ncbi:MAG: hypothetical protein ABJE10_02125 [bacterium]
MVTQRPIVHPHGIIGAARVVAVPVLTKDLPIAVFRVGAMSEEVRDRLLVDIDVCWTAAEGDASESALHES